MSTETAAPKNQTSGKAKEPIPPASIRISFPKKGKIQPEGWAGIGMSAEVRITLKGKIVSLSDNSREDWPDAGKEIRIELASCRIDADRARPMSMDEALDEAKKTRKRV